MSTLKPISAPLDRASELRSDEAALDRLWSAAKIIRVSDSKLASDGKSLQFLNAAEVEKAFTKRLLSFFMAGNLSSRLLISGRAHGDFKNLPSTVCALAASPAGQPASAGAASC